jgi:hypothetical protein
MCHVKNEKVVIMGCGCNKNKTAQVPGAGPSAARRATIYQVLSNGSITSEHDNLPEARIAATEVGGRVKVTSKMVL